VFVLTGTSIIRGLFRLGSPRPPSDLGGRYFLTFTADASCTSLPPQARVRGHELIIALRGDKLNVFQFSKWRESVEPPTPDARLRQVKIGDIHSRERRGYAVF
jgi:hypothetical protein